MIVAPCNRRQISGGRAGYDGAKRRKGSKVHAAVDTLGNLLTLLVTPATEQDQQYSHRSIHHVVSFSDMLWFTSLFSRFRKISAFWFVGLHPLHCQQGHRQVTHLHQDSM